MAITFHTFLLQLLLFFFASFAEANEPRETYLVQMKVGGHLYGSSTGHQKLLGQVLDDDSTVADAFIYSYKESFTGFSALLTQNERQKLKRRREVLEVSRSRNLELQTTRSWDFMNLTLKSERNPENESDLVVAVIDSGIWPYAELFTGHSPLPPPPEWANKCENIICNNKIVGARSYYPKEKYDWIEDKSVIDVTGHGTHVASIIAGRKIEEASYFGLAKGTMRGGVPNAKIAVYKTCWRVKKDGKEVSVCPEDSVLKAIDDAIEDKVDMISYSQGFVSIPLQKDHVSWAFLRALKHKILTSAAAGNSAKYYAVTNGAPWVMTVAASLKDRFFETKLEMKGEDDPITVYDTINTFETQDSFYPLFQEKALDEPTRERTLIADYRIKGYPILSKDSTHANDEEKDVFLPFSKIELLDKAIKERAKGAIVLGHESYDLNETKKLQFPIASIFLDEAKKRILEKYYRKDRSKCFVKIHKTREIRREEGWVPTVANISSRGPNCDNFLANILKPDIAAPGLDIIAGWPEDVKLSSDSPANDYRQLKFNLMTGTSMACPHATGLALYLRSFRHFSPSAIKSALMTTSTEMKDEGYEFAYGSGHLKATKVLYPGLVYETGYQDYIDYMCKLGYNTEKLKSHVGSDKIDCSKIEIDKDADLNYPTMTARVPFDKKFKKVFHRTVTHVDDREATYLRKINHAGEKDFDEIIVDPPELQFSKLGEKKIFTVTVTGTPKENWMSGEAFMTRNTWLTWTEKDGSRQVRSPIVIYSIKGPEACK